MRRVGSPLGRDDWVGAALRSIARGGIDAVAVEPIAAELGATKGSFYWHFKNRDALIEAALDRWSQDRTEAVIEHLEALPDAESRLRLLLAGGLELAATERVEIALLATPSHPVAVRAVEHVATRRIGYIATQLMALGWPAQAANDRAVLIYYLYVGHLQLAHAAPKLADERARRRHARLVFDALAHR